MSVAERQQELNALLIAEAKAGNVVRVVDYITSGALVPENLMEMLFDAHGRAKVMESLAVELCFAAGYGTVPTVKTLLSLGAEINGTNRTFCALRRVVGHAWATDSGLNSPHRKIALLFLAHHNSHTEECASCRQTPLPALVERELMYVPYPYVWMPVLSYILAATSARPTFTDLFGSGVSPEFQARRQRYERAAHPDVVQCAAFELMRSRMTEICIGMQALDFPALLTVIIMEETCWLPGTEFRRWSTWKLAAVVKHWFD